MGFLEVSWQRCVLWTCRKLLELCPIIVSLPLNSQNLVKAGFGNEGWKDLRVCRP